MANDYYPGKLWLKSATVAGSAGRKNFANDGAIELRLYEDICKYYLTGQLIIEIMQDAWDELNVIPLAPVEIEFETGRQNSTKTYKQFYKLYSYDTREIKAKSGGADARLIITLNLIGQEFFNDRHNTVVKGIPNKTGTEAVRSIHNEYVQATGGPILIFPSDGMIGSATVPHQANNVKPVKAIFDILDMIIFHREPTASPVYYRNNRQHVVAPLKTLIDTAGIVQNFTHDPAQGSKLPTIFNGWNLILDLKPVVPPAQVSAEGSAAFASLLNTTVFIDKKTGNKGVTRQSLGNFSDSLPNDPETRQRILAMIAEAKKTAWGGSIMFNLINDEKVARSVDKAASGHKAKQETFITALGFCKKFWVTVPINSGVEVTCGDNIQVVYPDVANNRTKTNKLFVPRLIHRLKFTEIGQQGNRSSQAIQGTTDIYGVLW